MPTFKVYHYRAIDSKGRLIEGEIATINKVKAFSKLQEEKLHIIDINLCENRESYQPTLTKKQSLPQEKTFRWKIEERATYLRRLQMMFQAGIPIFTALEACSQHPDPKISSRLLTIAEETSDGIPLPLAFHKSQLFQNCHTRPLQIALSSGNLDGILEALAEVEEKRANSWKKIKSQLTYPLFITIVMALSILVMSQVIGSVLGNFIQLGVEEDSLQLKLALLMTSPKATFGTLALFVLFLSALKFAWGRPDSRERIEAFLWLLPLCRNSMRDLIQADFARHFALMAGSGVPIAQALILCAQASPTFRGRYSLAQAREHLKNGLTLTESLEKTKILSPMTIAMVHTAEESGDLEGTFKLLAQAADDQIEHRLELLNQLLEPLVLLVLGTFVMIVMLVALGPIIQVLEKLTL